MFTATLEYGNRKGNDFKKVEQFITQAEAEVWLKQQAENKLCPEGYVTGRFHEVVFVLAERWEYAA